MASTNAADTRFLNVDLDVFSASPLQPLAEAFGDRVSVLHVGRHGRRYRAHFELRSSANSDANRLIAGFVRLVSGLPRGARSIWNQATRRDFNIGIQAGQAPHSYELFLEPETLGLASRVNARVGVTIYAEQRSPPRQEGRRNDVGKPGGACGATVAPCRSLGSSSAVDRSTTAGAPEAAADRSPRERAETAMSHRRGWRPPISSTPTRPIRSS